jgi:hypothetical protein
MNRRDDPGQARRAPAKPLTFLSRADLLELRGRRNYNRYMMVVKRFVAADGPERVQWQKESAQEAQHHAEWHRRHGSVPGGASILRWQTDFHTTSEARHTADSQHAHQSSRSHADDR